MIVLGLDSSGASCSVALIDGPRLVARRHEAMARGQAERLLPMVQETMAEAGIGFPEVELIAVTIGPGAFTGLRIGLAAARGLGLAAQRPVAGVTSFEAIAQGVPEAARRHHALLVAIDAKRADLFLQCFDAGLLPLAPPRALRPESVPGILPEGKILVAGDGAPRLREILDGRAAFAESSPAIDAAVVARIAGQRAIVGAPALEAKPLYLRAPDVTLPK